MSWNHQLIRLHAAANLSKRPPISHLRHGARLVRRWDDKAPWGLQKWTGCRLRLDLPMSGGKAHPIAQVEELSQKAFVHLGRPAGQIVYKILAKCLDRFEQLGLHTHIDSPD